MATVPPATPLWQASSEAIANSNLSAYQRFINGEHGLSFSSYQQLHRWSVDNSEDFWESIWHFSRLIASRRYDEVLEDKEHFPGAHWLPGAELNFAENLLRYAQYEDAASKIAIVARLENGELVCSQAFPSCPIAFWVDEHDEKFHAAYFNTYPNIWAHGDVGEVTANGGIVIHGRSDAVLNPGGVRIG